MRPVTLTIKAFGSFAKETTVRFADFQSGLYLIVGETGAGKTTIFDAIVFALFGTASGSNRKPDMMHSDYVEKSEDTEVKLTFEQGGKLYEVTRTIHFRKKRGTENEYGDGTPDAVLTLPEEPPVRGHAAVTKHCEDLLGLNADQFRRIIMLAQGEFREFLAADAAKKSDILGRLFDSAEYIRYQNLLSVARAALAERRKQYRDAVDTVMHTAFQAPETEDDDILYLPGNPELIDNLDRLIDVGRQRVSELIEQKAAAQKAVDDFNTKKGAAEGANQKLDELFAAREHSEKLAERQAEMELCARQYALAEKALHRVCPAQEKWNTANSIVEKANQDIEALHERVSALQAEHDAAQTALNSDEENRERILRINADCQKIADNLPQYDALEERLSELEKESAAAGEVKTKLSVAEAQRKSGAEELETAQSELAELEGADMDAVRLETQYEQAKANAAEFNGNDGVKHNVERILKEEGALQADEETLAALAREAGEAESQYHYAYQAFIEGQAGLLASTLETELNENGSAVCPVCHSEFRTGQPHEFAQYVDGTPAQSEVDSAKKRFEQCEKRRSDQYSDVEKQKIKLSSQKENLLARAKKLLSGCETWEQLSSEEYLANAVIHFEQTEAETKVAYEEAKLKQSRKTELKEQCDKLAAELASLAQEIEHKKEILGNAEKRITALEAEANTLRENLPYVTRKEANEHSEALTRERDELNVQIDAHQKAFDAAREALGKAQGELSSKETALPEQEKAEADAKRGFETALSVNGFADFEALDAALAPMGEDDREDWLTQQQAVINAYKNDCANTEERIKALTEQTKGLSYTNLEELKKQLGEAGEARDAAEKACSSQQELLKNHVSVRQRAADALNELANTDSMWERLDRLAELALGANAEGGKLSFERYVMGSIFREVLEMANRRLDIMSGGCYSLVHTMNAGRSNAVAGLEIEVLDIATGKQRPANSLSGGESFQVSLSLALGLSDVVQSHAGGIGLDTIFIDEGFGALDSGALDNAITVLNQLTEGNRLVGIISHVDKLEESIPQKLRVKKTTHGSEIASELS